MTKARYTVRIPASAKTANQPGAAFIAVTSISVDGVEIKEPTPEQLNRLFRPYAVELGNLVFAWNRLQVRLSKLFWKVSGIQNEAVPLAIWHSTPSDLSQRKMLRAAVEIIFANDATKKADLIWLVNRVDQSLAHKRNDAIHGPLEFFTDIYGTSLEPDLGSGSPQAKRLQGKKLLDEFRWYRETADALSNYAQQIFYFLLWRERALPRPWPDKPQLPSLSPKKSRKAQPRRQKTTKSPRRPPRSSRA